MPKEQLTASVDYRDEPIPEATLTDIGKLVRACAEVEDIVTLLICRLAEIGEGRAIILLGRVNLRKRVEVAINLAETLGPRELGLVKGAFGKVYEDAVDCRNTVAHGKYLGVVDENELAFLTADYDGPSPDLTAAGMRVKIYPIDTITTLAQLATDIIAHLERDLNVLALRRARLEQSIDPTPKAQKQKKRGAKQSHPPRSSQA